MTREQAKKNLISLGITEPTEENITNYLNTVNGEIKKEKDKAENLKTEIDQLKEIAGQVEELQKQKEELEQGNLTEIEKANKALEDVNKANADLQKQLNEMKFAKSLADKGIVGEQANEIVKSFMAGDFEAATTSISQIISERESAAALAKEQEIANLSGNPGGQNAGDSDRNFVAKDIAVASAKRAGAANESILNNYRR